MTKNTTGEPVSADALTHTHSHRQRRQRDGALLEAHGLSTKQRQPPESEENQENEEKALVAIRQHFVLPKNRSFSPYLSLSFIAQGGRSLQPVTSSLFSVLSDRDAPRFLPNECVCPRIFTSAYLHIKYVQLPKLVPTCKGRFTHSFRRFRLGTVFSTTSAPT